MTSPPHANGFQGGDEADGQDERSLRPNAKTLQHQVREVHRLVDHAVENLEQVLRALRYMERDL